MEHEEQGKHYTWSENLEMEHEEQGKHYTWSEILEMEQDKTIDME